MSGQTTPGAGFRERTIEASGYRLRYVEAGEGPVIILIPGSAGLELSIAKDLLAVDHRVVEINPPGWGSADDVEGQMELSALAGILANAIAALGIDRYALVGTSMGGTTAMWLTQRYPDRVRALLLEGPEVFVRQGDRRVVNASGETVSQQVRRGVPEAELVYPVTAPHPRKPWATAEFNRQQMRDRFRMFTHFTNTQAPDLVAGARTLAVPTLCLLGDEDEIIMPSVAAAWAENMPQAQHRMVAGGRHDLQNSTPEYFADTARRFFAANP